MTQELEKAATAPPAQESSKGRTTVFPDFREEMDRLWAALMTNPWRPFRMTGQPALLPTMDVFEKDGRVEVKVELPGIPAEDVDVSIDEGVLTVTGEKKEEKEVKEATYHRAERTYGRFSRQIVLPANIDADAATAKFEHGVLQISIPTKDVNPPTAKKIQIS